MGTKCISISILAFEMSLFQIDIWRRIIESKHVNSKLFDERENSIRVRLKLRETVSNSTKVEVKRGTAEDCTYGSLVPTQYRWQCR